MTTEADKLRQQHTDELREAERRDEARTLCPFPPRLVVSHRDHIGLTFGDAFAALRYPKPGEVLTADHVRTLLDTFPPTKCERRRAGCLATRPAKLNGKSYADAPLEGVHYIGLRLDGGRGYGPHLRAQWYTESRFGLLSIGAELSPNAPHMPRAVKLSGSYDRATGQPTPHTWRYENAPADAVTVGWAPGQADGYIREWFFERVDDFRAWLNGYEAPTT